MMFRGAIGLYVVSIFALVAGYFAVSTMDLESAMYLQASSTLQADTSNAARGIVMDVPTGRLYTNAKTTFAIGNTPIGSASTASHGHLHAELRPPASLAGPQKMTVTVTHPAIEEFRMDADIDVVAQPPPFVWPKATSRLVDEKKSTDAIWTGELRVMAIPPEGEIPRGLPAVAYFLLVDAATNAPVRGTLQITKLEGMVEKALPTELTTDDLGLVKVSVTAATSLRFTIEASAGERKGSGTVRLSTVPSQFSVAPTSLVAVPGQPLTAQVTTLHRSGGILVDLYDGERWAAADAFGVGPSGAGVRVTVPADARGPLVRLQVYQDLFDAGSAWDAQWLVVGPSAAPNSCPAALDKVLALLETNSERFAGWAKAARAIAQGPAASARCGHWLQASLLAVPPQFVPAPLLLNTQQGDREELEGWRDEVQRVLIVATALVLLIGFGIVMLLVLQGLARRQQQVDTVRELELELATDEDLASPLPRVDLDRWVLIVQTTIIVLTLFTFGASLLMLLTWM